MKTPNVGFRLVFSVWIAVYFLFVLQGTAAESESVLGPNKRQEALVHAKELLGEKAAVISAKNPFNPEGFGESAPVAIQGPVINTAPVGPRSEKDLLQAIAAGLKPRLVVMAGQPVLFFGQKRVKAGGSLTITFEGSEYTLEVVSIAQPNFTLRLNREEFTRPIK